jgi:hypothetical protein
VPCLNRWAAATLLNTPTHHSCSTTYGGALNILYTFFFYFSIFVTTSIEERTVDNFNILYTLLCNDRVKFGMNSDSFSGKYII